MAIERSYGRLIWRDKILKFKMINANGQQFEMFAEPLIEIYNYPGRYIRIKKKDSNPKDHSYYHQGEIYGLIEGLEEEEKEEDVTLFLYKGPSEEKMILKEYDDGAELLGVVITEEYIFPRDEFIQFVKCIDVMYSQHTHFTMLRMHTYIHYSKDDSLLLR